jgi:hypothetical protein
VKDLFDVTYTENHWSNEEKVIGPFETVIFPFVESKRRFAWGPKGITDL